MSRYDDDTSRPRRSSGLPTWLVVTLSIVLLFGLLCAGGIAMLIYASSKAIDSGMEEYTNQSLLELANSVRGYQQTYSEYPDSLATLKNDSPNAYLNFSDYRDGGGSGNATFVYLTPAANAQPDDIVAHTRTSGPMPILAVLLRGSIVEFKTVRALDDALFLQQTRILSEDPPFVPPTVEPPDAGTPQNGTPPPTGEGVDTPLLPQLEGGPAAE